MKAIIASSFTRFTAIGSFVTLFIDLAQPIFPFAMLAAVVFLGLSVLLFCLQSVPGAVRHHAKTAFPFTMIMMVLSFGTWMFQSTFDDADESGVLASTFPAFGKMQDQMTDLVDINKRIADATEDISQTSARTADATEELTETAKKETSEDPRKELQNLGLPWGDQNFWKALRLGDERALSLFMQAGLPVSKSEISKYALIGKVSTESARKLSGVGFSLTKAECDFSRFVNPSKVDTIKVRWSRGNEEFWSMPGGKHAVVRLTEGDTAGSLSLLCPKQHLRKEIKRVIDAGLSYPDVYQEHRVRLINECEKESTKTTFENYVAVATDGDINFTSDSDYAFTDEYRTHVNPKFPARDLTTSETIVRGSLYKRAVDSLSDGFNGMIIDRDDSKKNGATWFGYKNTLKRVCTTVAYPKLDTDNLKWYERIKDNFSFML